MNEVAQKLTFEEKMKNRIKEGIGDLLSDEDLSKMINTAMHDVFFKERRDTSSYNTKVTPPFLHEIVQDVMKDSVTKEVSKYIQDNPVKVENVIKTVIENGMGAALMKSMNYMFQNDLYNLQNNIVNNLQNKRY